MLPLVFVTQVEELLTAAALLQRIQTQRILVCTLFVVEQYANIIMSKDFVVKHQYKNLAG